MDIRNRAESIAAVLPPLLLAAERVAATVAQGVHGRRRVGQGETFWQFRHYEPGDQPNRIDWRRSALGDQVFVREAEWEAAQSVWLWSDASASMHYASRADLPQKAERAVLLLIALMSLLVRGGERVALLGLANRPATGRAALNRLAEFCLSRLAAPGATTELPAVMPLPRHAAAVLIGDFLSPPEDIAATVRAIAGRGVRGHLLHILDPAEVEMPFRGRSRFLGLEAEGDLLVGRAESLRDSYLRRLAALQARLTDIARATGWTYAVHHTDQSPQAALLSLYMALAAPRPSEVAC